MTARPRSVGARLAEWTPAILFGVVLLLITADGIDTFASGKQRDFIHFYEAARAVLDGTDPYASGTGGYIYPPLFAILLTPLAGLTLAAAGVVWTIINAVLYTLAASLLAREVLERCGFSAHFGGVWLIALLSTLVLADKLKAVVTQGQTDIVILLGVVLALRWLARRPALAGLPLAAVMNVKYQTLAFLPYLLIRRRWRSAAAFALGTVSLALGGALVFGWGRNLELLSTAFRTLGEVVGLAPTDASVAAPHELTWDRSVAIPSAFARAAHDLGLDPRAATAAVALTAAGVAALCWTLFRAHGHNLFVGRSQRADDASPGRALLVLLEWTGVVVASLAFSPQTEARHMLIALPLVATAAAFIVHPRAGVPRWPAIAAVVVFVAGLYLPPGGERFNDAVESWRAVGGASWCLLAMYVLTLWPALRWARSLGAPTPAEPERA